MKEGSRPRALLTGIHGRSTDEPCCPDLIHFFGRIQRLNHSCCWAYRPSKFFGRVLKDFTSRDQVHNSDRDVAANGSEKVPPVFSLLASRFMKLINIKAVTYQPCSSVRNAKGRPIACRVSVNISQAQTSISHKKYPKAKQAINVSDSLFQALGREREREKVIRWKENIQQPKNEILRRTPRIAGSGTC